MIGGNNSEKAVRAVTPNRHRDERHRDNDPTVKRREAASRKPSFLIGRVFRTRSILLFLLCLCLTAAAQSLTAFESQYNLKLLTEG